MPDKILSLKKDFIDKGLMTDLKWWAFGKDPIVAKQQVGFAAGNSMFSICAALSFKCPSVREYNVFKFVFCAKLHSKIYRKDPANRSRWYIWRPVQNSGCVVMDTESFKKLTGINVYDLVRTPDFVNLQQIFKKTIQKGIDGAIELRSEISKEDKNEYEAYIKSLEEAKEIVTQMPDIMDKTFKLIDYDKFTDEIKKNGYGEELARRGEIMTKHHREIGTKFVDKVKQNALKAGEQERKIQHDLKNK